MKQDLHTIARNLQQLETDLTHSKQEEERIKTLKKVIHELLIEKIDNFLDFEGNILALYINKADIIEEVADYLDKAKVFDKDVQGNITERKLYNYSKATIRELVYQEFETIYNRLEKEEKKREKALTKGIETRLINHVKELLTLTTSDYTSIFEVLLTDAETKEDIIRAIINVNIDEELKIARDIYNTTIKKIKKDYVDIMKQEKQEEQVKIPTCWKIYGIAKAFNKMFK